jgi:hypothetical protein
MNLNQGNVVFPSKYFLLPETVFLLAAKVVMKTIFAEGYFLLSNAIAGRENKKSPSKHVLKTTIQAGSFFINGYLKRIRVAAYKVACLTFKIPLTMLSNINRVLTPNYFDVIIATKQSLSI